MRSCNVTPTLTLDDIPDRRLSYTIPPRQTDDGRAMGMRGDDRLDHDGRQSGVTLPFATGRVSGIALKRVIGAASQVFGMAMRGVAIPGQRATLRHHIGQILGIGAGEDVGLIATLGIVAGVAGEPVAGHRTIGQLPGEAVGDRFALSRYPDAAIAVTIAVAEPRPAGIGPARTVDATPERDFDWFVHAGVVTGEEMTAWPNRAATTARAKTGRGKLRLHSLISLTDRGGAAPGTVSAVAGLSCVPL